MVVELSNDEVKFIEEMVSHKVDNLRKAYKNGVVPLDEQYKSELANLLGLKDKLHLSKEIEKGIEELKKFKEGFKHLASFLQLKETNEHNGLEIIIAQDYDDFYLSVETDDNELVIQCLSILEEERYEEQMEEQMFIDMMEQCNPEDGSL